MISLEKTLKGIAKKNFNILKTSNENSKFLIKKMETTTVQRTREKEKEPTEGPGKRTRARIRKNMEKIDPQGPQVQNVKDTVQLMEALKSNVALMLRILA